MMSKKHLVHPAMVTGKSILKVIVILIVIAVITMFCGLLKLNSKDAIPEFSQEAITTSLPTVAPEPIKPIVLQSKQVYTSKDVSLFSDSEEKVEVIPVSTVLQVSYVEGDALLKTEFNGKTGYVSKSDVTDYFPELHIEIGLEYQHQDLVREVVDLLGVTVDEYFFYGMMYTESRFRVLAESYAGAQGIMQIMPATWNSYYSMFCDEYPEFAETIQDDVLDIRSNITIGIYIVHKISEDCDVQELGNEHKILTTYNRGPGGASKYYKSKGTYTSEYSQQILRAAEYIREHKSWKEGL